MSRDGPTAARVLVRMCTCARLCPCVFQFVALSMYAFVCVVGSAGLSRFRNRVAKRLIVGRSDLFALPCQS